MDASENVIDCVRYVMKHLLKLECNSTNGIEYITFTSFFGWPSWKMVSMAHRVDIVARSASAIL